MKTFEFTEQEAELLRKEQYKYLINDNIDHFLLLVQQIVSERITPEAGESVKPVPSIPIVGGGSVASDRTEQCESAKEFLSKTTASGVIERKGVGEYSMSFDIDKLASILTIYASQVCADKDARIKFWIDGWNHLSRMYDQSQSELDRLNESLTVMVRKNAELQDQIERFKNPLKAK